MARSAGVRVFFLTTKTCKAFDTHQPFHSPLLYERYKFNQLVIDRAVTHTQP